MIRRLPSGHARELPGLIPARPGIFFTATRQRCLSMPFTNWSKIDSMFF